jgi:hypothetical protein
MKRIALSLEGLLPQERLTSASVVDIDDAGIVRIAYAPDDAPIRADVAIPLGDAMRDLVRAGDDVLVLLRGGDPNRPLIVSTIVDRLAADAPREAVTVRADRELVLQCGEASISLHADGRVVIRGGYVETYADGTNRIKGAQVRIN